MLLDKELCETQNKLCISVQSPAKPNNWWMMVFSCFVYKQYLKTAFQYVEPARAVFGFNSTRTQHPPPLCTVTYIAHRPTIAPNPSTVSARTGTPRTVRRGELGGGHGPEPLARPTGVPQRRGGGAVAGPRVWLAGFAGYLCWPRSKADKAIEFQ